MCRYCLTIAMDFSKQTILSADQDTSMKFYSLGILVIHPCCRQTIGSSPKCHATYLCFGQMNASDHLDHYLNHRPWIVPWDPRFWKLTITNEEAASCSPRKSLLMPLAGVQYGLQLQATQLLGINHILCHLNYSALASSSFLFSCFTLSTN